MGFYLYLLFILSWFLRLTVRYPVLGSIRFDLVILILTFVSMIFTGKIKKPAELNNTKKYLLYLIGFIAVTFPLVEWPGSVLHRGIENFVKAIVFYYFTVTLVTTEKKLSTFIKVYLGCQIFRVMEPLYMHWTQGYWGSRATMSNWEEMYRLSGAPWDVINPNGLAFIIVSVFPFLHFLSKLSFFRKLTYWTLAPFMINALILTSSRSGFLGLLIIAGGIWIKAQRKFLLTMILGVGGVIAFANLSADQRDRYFSIFSSHTRNSATASGRWDSVSASFKVAMRRPLFGHGLGTSAEANANFGIDYQLTHNLYAEVAQELGFIGLILYILFLYSVVANAGITSKQLKAAGFKETSYLLLLNNAMQVWLVMNMIFSFASYGLSTYEWYLFAGLTEVIRKVATESIEEKKRLLREAARHPDSNKEKDTL